MKNYKFVLGLAVAGLVAAPVQAADSTQPTAARASTPAVTAAARDAAIATLSPRPAYQFDSRPAGQAQPVAIGTSGLTDVPLERLAASLDKPSAQSFAGSTVAAAHASPAKSGLANTQAAPSSVAEPASELLLLLGLSALAIMIRRQSPT